MKQYEHYVLVMAGKEADVFRLESWALQWSTLALSILVAIYGLWLAFVEHEVPQGAALAVFGVAGLALSIFSDRLYQTRWHLIQRSGLDGVVSTAARRVRS